MEFIKKQEQRLMKMGMINLGITEMGMIKMDVIKMVKLEMRNHGDIGGEDH